MTEKQGDYVCEHCKLIYVAYPRNLRCDICGSDLKWVSAKEVERLDAKWGKKL